MMSEGVGAEWTKEKMPQNCQYLALDQTAAELIA
jgi:hypothetical protein